MRHAKCTGIPRAFPHMDTRPAETPTFEQFDRYFQYIGYDVINERVLQQHPGGGGDTDGGVGGRGVQYKRFVQSNKNTDWAREIIDSVSRVQAYRYAYAPRANPRTPRADPRCQE